MMALFSSEVAFLRLFDPICGRSERKTCQEKRPFSVKIRRLLGLGPHSGPPSGSLAVDETYVHVPTSCSLSDFSWATALPGGKTNPNAVSTKSLRVLRRIIFLSAD